jgi:hypothetical protein
MSRLQERAKPIVGPLILDNWSTLSPVQSKIVAMWAAMFTMVVEFADPKTQAITFEERDQFRLTQDMPPNWYVWVGRFNGLLWREGFNHFGWGPLQEFSSPPSPAEIALASKLDTQSTAFPVHRLFVMTFSSSRTGLKVDEGAFARRFGLRVMWPNPENPVVRPNQVLDDFSADSASAALQLAPAHLIRHAWQR